MGLKQARRWFVFPREFSSLFRASRVQLRRCSGNSAGLLRCRVTSPGKLSSATVDFVAPLRLWHGLRPPPMVGFVERESGGPASRSALRAFERAEFRSARELQGGRESEHANAPRLFNCPVWTPPTGGWSNQIVRMGRSSTHVHGFLARQFSCDLRNNFYPCI